MENNLVGLRKSAHLTQKALGYQLGLSQQVISRIEKNIDTITLDHLLLLSDFHTVSMDYLMGRTHIKRTVEEQQVLLGVLENNYMLVRAVEMLGPRDRALVWVLIEKMLDACKEV